MRKTVLLFFLCALFLLNGCFRTWSEKRKKEFSEKCEQTEVLDGLTFFVTGFSFSERDSILIKQMNNSLVIDSFYVHIRLSDSLRDRYSGWINKPVILNDTYYFIIPEEQTFVLSDMKMKIHPQFTMFSEGYGCQLQEYKIDGELNENRSNPDFRKKGYVFYWDRIKELKDLLGASH